MAQITGALHSANAYALLVLATTAAGWWRTRWAVRICTCLLLLSWAVNILVAPRISIFDLTEIYSRLHWCIGVAAIILLFRSGALWLAALAAIDLVQFALHFAVFTLVSEPGLDSTGGYRTAIAVCFTLQLGCIWMAHTALGRWWPPSWRPSDLFVPEIEDGDSLIVIRSGP